MTKLSRNILYNLSGQVLLLGISLIAVRFIFSRLGADILGIIYFISVINAVICAVLEAGICTTAVREISGHYRTEQEYVHRLIRTFSLFYWGMYVLAAAVVFLAAPMIARRWIQLSTIDIKTAVFMLRLLGVSALSALPKTYIVSLFKGLQRMEINNLIDVVFMGVQQLGIVLILSIGGGVYPVIWWYSICYVLWVFVYMLIAARFFTFKALLPGYFHDVFTRNFGFSVKMMSISVLTAIHTQADKLMVSKLLPISSMGYYGFLYAGISRANLIARSVSQAAYPSFSELFKDGNKKTLLSQYFKLHDMLCIAIVPVFAIFIFAFLPLFSFVFNPKVAQNLFVPALFLCIGFYMNGTLNMPYIHSLAVGRPELTVKVNFRAIFVVLPVAFFLIKRFGLTGAGFSWVFYHIFLYIYGVPKMCRECLEVPSRTWYLHILRIFVLIGLTYGLIGGYLLIRGSCLPAVLAISYIVATVIFAIGSYLIMRKEMKDVVKRYVEYFKNNVNNFWRYLSKTKKQCQE